MPSHAASTGRFWRTGRRASRDGGGFRRAGGRCTSHSGGERLCDGVIVSGELSEEEEDGHLQLHAPVVRVCSLSQWGIEERVWKKTTVCSFCGWGGWERVTARLDSSTSKADFIYFLGPDS
jgi:hypothetical protein